MHAVTIELLQKKHMKQVILLLQNLSVYLPPEDSYCDIWKSFINQTNVHSVVATENEQVVGYGAIVIETKIRGGKKGHIEDIISHPNKRNVGIGKMIVNSLFEIAKTNQCYKVSLQCHQQIISFYENCEFKLCGKAMERFNQ